MRYYLAILVMFVLTAYSLYLVFSNGGKRLGVLGKVVDKVNKATDSLNPAEKRTYKAERREKKANLKEKKDEKTFAEHFKPQMAAFRASLADD